MDNLLNLIFKAASVEPRYDQDVCLTASGKFRCTSCRDACPHDAIRIGNNVQIDDVNCSGCGLCVNACPSNALEPGLTLKREGSARCSRLKGNAQSVQCLGQLQASDLLRLADNSNNIKLAHADCADCSIGTAAVPVTLDHVVNEAEELAMLHGRELSVEVIQAEHFDKDETGKALSRRELLRGGWRNVQSGAETLLAPLEYGEDEGKEMPREASRRLAIIRAARPEQKQVVPWALPRVGDGCIMCPACTEVCPTTAFSRDFTPSDGQGAVLLLDPARCVGCEACVDVCPVNVIRMDAQVTWGELSGGSGAAHRRRPRSNPAVNEDVNEDVNEAETS